MITACIFYASSASSALTADDKKALRRAFESSGLSQAESDHILRDNRLVLYPEILKQKRVDYLHPRFGLLSRSSIDRGRRIMQVNKTTLRRVEARYGVPREVLVAIFRVETNLGSNLGRYRVFNSLLTLTVMVNRRSPWAGRELINLLILCKKNRMNPFSIKGSAAGAFGLCQFVPSAYLAYGTDGNGDRKVNLFDFSDAMASTAHYLKSHGWHNRDARKQMRAVLAYNHCENYARAVLAYSKHVKGGNGRISNPVRKPQEVRGVSAGKTSLARR